MADAVLRLKRIRCDRQEDYVGADHVLLIGRAGDGRPQRLWHGWMTKDQILTIIRPAIQIQHQLSLELQEEDDWEPNDNIGRVIIPAVATPPEGQVIRFAGSGAHYTVRYTVETSPEPEPPYFQSPEPAWCAPEEDKNREQFSHRRVKSPYMTCRDADLTWVDLWYRYANGDPVPFAKYVIEDDAGRRLTGRLNDQGYEHVDGLPVECARLRFWFDDDPESYQIFPDYQPKHHNIRVHDTDSLITRWMKAVENAVEDGTEWVWGAIQGDFNEQPGMGQIAFNTVVGLIPLADQVLDMRDLTANIYFLVRDSNPPGYTRRDYWLNFFITLIGSIPEVGTVIKGVFKTLKHSGEAAAHGLFRTLTQILNDAGQGNVVRWLQAQLEKFPEYVRWSTTQARELFAQFDTAVQAAQRRVQGLWDRLANQLLALSDRIARARDQVAEMFADWAENLREKLQRILNGRQREVHVASPKQANGVKQSRESLLRGGEVPVDPEIDEAVERAFQEFEGNRRPACRPPRRRPATNKNSKAAYRSYKPRRQEYAERLGASDGDVHHAIERQTLDRYPGVFSEEELNHFSNMRGIGPEEKGRKQLHNSKIYEMWDRHYRQLDDEINRRGLEPGTEEYNQYVRAYIESARDEIDHVLGQFFTEYRTGRPRAFD